MHQCTDPLIESERLPLQDLLPQPGEQDESSRGSQKADQQLRVNRRWDSEVAGKVRGAKAVAWLN